MNRPFKKFFGLVLLGSICFGCDSNGLDKSALTGKDKQVIVDFPEVGEKIKLNARVWGVAGNHEEISIFSSGDSNSGKPPVQQTFYTSEIFYKKKGKDTLEVFAPSSSYKDDVLKVIDNIQIDIHPLKGADEVEHYSKRYQELKLKRISIYE